MLSRVSNLSPIDQNPEVSKLRLPLVEVVVLVIIVQASLVSTSCRIPLRFPNQPARPVDHYQALVLRGVVDLADPVGGPLRIHVTLL